MTTSVKEEVKQLISPGILLLDYFFPEDEIDKDRIVDAMKEYAKAYSKQQNHELLEATKELMRFKSSMKYAMSNALNEPENFLKALDNLENLISKSNINEQ